MFMNKSNIYKIVNAALPSDKIESQGKFQHLGQLREKRVRQLYNEWVKGDMTNLQNLRFKQTLSFEIFCNKTNWKPIVVSLMGSEDRFNDVLVENFAREFYNSVLIKCQLFPPEFEFLDGSTIEDYFMPTIKDKVIEYTDQMIKDFPPGAEKIVYSKPCPKSKKPYRNGITGGSPFEYGK